MEPNEILPPSGLYFVNTVPANGTFDIQAEGDHFYFTESEGRLIVSTDKSAASPFSVGEGETLPPGNEFKNLVLTNETADDIDFEIFVGRNRRIDRRLNVVDGRLASVERVMKARLEMDVSTVVSIANAAFELFDGVAVAPHVQRDHMIVTNEDPNSDLDWADTSGNVGGKIGPKEKIKLEGDDAIRIANSSGGAITCKITEWWVVLS